jgi:hypothetical protein
VSRCYRDRGFVTASNYWDKHCAMIGRILCDLILRQIWLLWFGITKLMNAYKPPETTPNLPTLDLTIPDDPCYQIDDTEKG